MSQVFSKSCQEKKLKYQQWVRTKVDYDREKQQKPYTFFEETSFWDSQLPSAKHLPGPLDTLFMESVIDQDMESDLERAGILNWCPQAIKLHAINVPRDGNCLLHSASVAIWGTEDTQSILRDLMLMTMTNDYNNSYKNRWWRQRLRDLQSLQGSAQEIIDQEWDDVIRSISSLGNSALCAAVPHRFLESVHIYVLANILRRPVIILSDNLARSVSGHSLQENHISGLYLPLEWPARDCSKTPLIIGYSFSHFCPLISESGSSKSSKETSYAFPLVDKDFSLIPVRYLKEQEEHKAWDLVQTYLNVRELAVEGKDRTKTTVPFAQLKLKTWPHDMNMFHDHLKIVEDKYKETTRMGAGVASGIAQHPENPFYSIQLSSQTEVAPVRGTKDRMGKSRPAGSQGARVPGSKMAQAGAESQKTSKKCRNDMCSKQGNPAQAYLCDDCLRNLTIAESGGELVSMHEGNISKYVLKTDPAQAGDMTQTGNRENVVRPEMNTQDHEVIPSAPPPSHIELESFVEPASMMQERCKNTGCGYRASKETFPYCHECYDRVRRSQERVLVVPFVPAENTKSQGLEGKIAFAEAAGMNVLNPSGQSSPAGSFSAEGSEGSGNMTWQGKTVVNYGGHRGNMESKIRNDMNITPMGQPFTFKDKPFKSSGMAGGSVNHQRYAEQSGRGAEQAFAETETKNMNGDVEVSEEPEATCVSPYCNNFVLQPNQLCQRCTAILKMVSKQNQVQAQSTIQATSVLGFGGREIEAQREKEKVFETSLRPPSGDEIHESSGTYQASRGKFCITEGCPNFGDPIMDNMCSLCYFKKNPQKKAQTRQQAVRRTELASESTRFLRNERIAHPTDDLQQLSIAHPPGSEPNPLRNPSAPTTSQRNVGELYSLSNSSVAPSALSSFAPSSSHWNPNPAVSTSLAHLSSKSLMVTSKTSAAPYSESMQQTPSSTSQSLAHKEDREFNEKFQGIEQRMRNANKCVMGKCPNFGNSQKQGYCNACYHVIETQKQREKELLEYGEDVPDSLCKGQS